MGINIHTCAHLSKHIKYGPMNWNNIANEEGWHFPHTNNIANDSNVTIPSFNVKGLVRI